MIGRALDSFDHGSKRYKRGEAVNVPRATLLKLHEKGLVSIHGHADKREPGAPANPQAASGQDSPLSASPLAQASPQTTSSESDGGGSPSSDSIVIPPTMTRAQRRQANKDAKAAREAAERLL